MELILNNLLCCKTKFFDITDRKKLKEKKLITSKIVKPIGNLLWKTH
jgi:hypothetical protein